MMKILFIKVIICLTLLGHGQKAEELPLPKDPFQKINQISGIAVRMDTLFFASAKCKMLFLIDKNSLKNLGYIDLSTFFAEEIEIRGLALMDNHLYMADGKDFKIWDYDLSLKKMDSLNIHPGLKELQKEIHGIAIRDSMLFLSSDRYINVYRLNHGERKLAFMCQIKTEQKPLMGSHYSDIYYDTSIDRLIYVFREQHSGRSPITYLVESIDANAVSRDTTFKGSSITRLYTFPQIHYGQIVDDEHVDQFESITADSNFIFLMGNNYGRSMSELRFQEIDRNNLCNINGALPVFVRISRQIQASSAQ